MSLRPLYAIALTLLIVSGACGDTPNKDASPRPTTPLGHRVDWTGGSVTITLDNGWQIAPCESGPRQLCVRNGAEAIGTVELNDYPISTVPELQRARGQGASTQELLRLHVEEYFRIFVEERPLGCGADHVVRPRKANPASFGGERGVSYGFDTLRNGKLVERVRNWAIIAGDSLFVMGAAGVEPKSCMDDSELADLSLTQFKVLLPVLDAIVRNSALPEPLTCAKPGVPGVGPCS